MLPVGAGSPLEDAALDAAFQKAIVGMTGLPGNMVRPRWQPTPPKQPEPATNWCAFGVMIRAPWDVPAIEHIGTGNGSDVLRRHEEIDILCTFYGPNAQRFAMLLRDGLVIPQNIEELKSQSLYLVGAGDLRAAPELINQQWVKRYDIGVAFRRQIVRTYAIENLLSADPTLINDQIGVIATTNAPE